MSAPRRVRVLVTRPAAQAAAWVARLRERGVDAEPLPLIEIAPCADPAPLHEAWRALAQSTLVVFVSANAVEQFFAARPVDVRWPDGVVAGAPGPGTAEALCEAGVPAASIVRPAPDAPSFDSEALWERLREREWRGAQVTVVRGAGGREWLAERLREHGAQVEIVSAYRRLVPAFAGALGERLGAALADERSVWLFSSSEAIANLAGAAGANRWRRARAVATHPRIAERARALGFGEVVECGATLDAVVACIQSIEP